MPEFKPRTKAPKSQQLADPLQGELNVYLQTGLYQRQVGKKTVYRYRGALLAYQKALQGQQPGIQNSLAFLAHLRKAGYKPNTLKVIKSALQGFHEWRGERLEFTVKPPRHQPAYLEPEVIEAIITAGKSRPRDYAVLLLLADAGLRKEEVAGLTVSHVGVTNRMLKIRGKGDRDRAVPMTMRLTAALNPFCQGKAPTDSLLGITGKAVYLTVKRWAPELHPHQLRHCFASQLLAKGVNVRAVQDLLGHSSLATTEIYLQLAPDALTQAIAKLEPAQAQQEPPQQPADDQPFRMSWERPENLSPAERQRQAKAEAEGRKPRHPASTSY